MRRFLLHGHERIRERERFLFFLSKKKDSNCVVSCLLGWCVFNFDIIVYFINSLFLCVDSFLVKGKMGLKNPHFL